MMKSNNFAITSQSNNFATKFTNFTKIYQDKCLNFLRGAIFTLEAPVNFLLDLTMKQ